MQKALVPGTSMAETISARLSRLSGTPMVLPCRSGFSFFRALTAPASLEAREKTSPLNSIPASGLAFNVAKAWPKKLRSLAHRFDDFIMNGTMIERYEANLASTVNCSRSVTTANW